MGTHIKNVTMQQSTGHKSNMPTARPVAELLVALNEFNKYELYTGTGDGVQPLYGDGTGSSNVSFELNQDNATSINGKFVYFDTNKRTWELAYAQANPVENEHFTAQGFAVSSGSSDLQVTTSGKLIVPFQMTDYQGTPVVAGSYYYLCQDKSNAGLIQQAAPSSGIMQIVCQIISVSEDSTTILLLNDLGQVANDIIQTDGDGSKYLGDDGQYHAMQIASLAGRTSNCMEQYEILDISYENVAAACTDNEDFVFPALEANGTINTSEPATNAVSMSSVNDQGVWEASVTDGWKVTSDDDYIYKTTYEAPVSTDFRWQFEAPVSVVRFEIKNHSDPAQQNKNFKQGHIEWFDISLNSWVNQSHAQEQFKDFLVVNPSNEPGAISYVDVPVDNIINNGLHNYWGLTNVQNFDDEVTDIACAYIRPVGWHSTVTSKSYGYQIIGTPKIEDNIVSEFSEDSYVISKSLVESQTQYTFDVRAKFSTVEGLQPIWSAPNSTNYLAIENGSLKLVLNSIVYKGNTTFKADTYYVFRFNYSKESGYTVSYSEDEKSYTNDLLLYDDFNYLDGITIYLGMVRIKEAATIASISIDLSKSGFSMKNSIENTSEYPFTKLTTKNIATITVTAKVKGLIASGRSAGTTTLQVENCDVDTVKNTIVATDRDTLVWEKDNGLNTVNYEEVDYYRQYDGNESDSVVYAKDTNYCYKQTIIYPNFLSTNVLLSPDTNKYKLNLIQNNKAAVFDTNTGLATTLTYDAFISKDVIDVGDKPWKFETTFTTPDTASWSTLWCPIVQGDTYYGPLEFLITNKKNLSLGLYYNDGEQTSANTDGTFTLADSTTYNVEVEFTGTQYIARIKTPDITDFIDDITIESTKPIRATRWYFGSNLNLSTAGSNCFLTNMDYTATKLTIDGKLYLQCAEKDTQTNDVMVDLSKPNAEFHPNVFLNRNGFNFNLKLTTTGALQLDRPWSAKNYGGTTDCYNKVEGCEWSTFVNDGNYTQGIKISSYLNTPSIAGTAASALYCLTVGDPASYTTTTYANLDNSIPGFFYFSFEHPVRFDEITFVNYKDANYVPAYICAHVSNDMTNWYSIIPESQSGYTKNGMLGGLPIDVYADFLNKTANALHRQLVVMPDNKTYYKYVRLGFYRDNYHAVVSGCFIGSSTGDRTQFNQCMNMRELIFEKENFINSGSSGINAAVVRRKIGEAYQVKFLDKIGWTQKSPDTAVVDTAGKKLLANEELVYQDPEQKYEIAQQTLAYQTHCKQYLDITQDQGCCVALSPGLNWNATPLMYGGSANTGTVANSFNLLRDNTTYYDFNNALNESAFVITCPVRLRAHIVEIHHNSAAAYNPQQIKVYGSVDGGNTAGTSNFWGTSEDSTAPEAVWEEIPIKSWQNGNVSVDDPWTGYETQNPLSFCYTANDSNTNVYAAANASYMYRLYIEPRKAYLQYKVTVQRTVNNKVVLKQIYLRDWAVDPWASIKNVDGELLPIPVILPVKDIRTTVDATLPDKKTLTNKGTIYATTYSPTTAIGLTYDDAHVTRWTPGNDRKWVNVQFACKYPICAQHINVVHYTDFATYGANIMEVYGTNYTDYATKALGADNPLSNWTRLSSTVEKSDMPTQVNVAAQDAAITTPATTYGYSYFTYLTARTINNSIHMNVLTPMGYLAKTFVENLQSKWSKEAYFTQEWKWTNVPGEKDEVREGACYNHPLLQIGDWEDLDTTYALKKRDDDYTYYTFTKGEKDSFLPNGTVVGTNTSMMKGRTLPFENRWMYRYTDINKDVWFSPVGPDDMKSHQYMYKSAIPMFNKEYYTGIPLTATANEGSNNEFTYACTGTVGTTGEAFRAFNDTVETAATSCYITGCYNTATGEPTADAPTISFISPKPIVVNGYTIGSKVILAGLTDFLQWTFEGSNDGEQWTVLDTRDTEKEENPDSHVCMQNGTSYYFENETAYTHYRWTIKKVTTGTTALRFKCFGLFVLEEVPLEVLPIFELSYTDTDGQEQKAYTYTSGDTSDYISNGIIIYKDIKFQEPLENTWAYSVSFENNVYYTKVPGEQGTYVPEETTLYTDKDFKNEYETKALVDTWEYTGAIEKRYKYTGEKITDYTYDGEEPYNKYFYTGETANQYKYTGEIEGWQYTGVKQDLYDDVPNIEITLNRDDARKVVKQTYIGAAYPVTNKDNMSGTSYYSFTSGDSAGTVVPQDTPLYASLDAIEPTATADGTDNYVYSSSPMQSRYSKEYLYAPASSASENTPVDENTTLYKDAALTEKAEVAVTEYTYTKDSEPSEMTKFYHRMEDVNNNTLYNVGLSFDGNKYTSTIYAKDATVDTQEFESKELIKSSYFGPETNLKKHSVLLMGHQNIMTLNLSKSDYSWWEWNKLLELDKNLKQVSLFRLALLEGSAGSIDEVYELYPWRVGDGGKAANIPILDPTLGIPEKSVIENVYIIADINELLNNPDIPKNTLILGYGGYL